MVLGLFVALVGCNRSVESQLNGTWTQVAHGDSFFERMMVNLFPKVTVAFRPDHSFTVSIPSFDLKTVASVSTFVSRKVVEGTWKVQGRTVLFDSKTSDGKSVTLLRAEAATARSKAELEQHDRMVQEAIQRQLATQGQGGPPSQNSSGSSDRSQAPTYARPSDELVLPERAELSKSGNKLTLRFEGYDETVDLEQGESGYPSSSGLCKCSNDN